DEERSRPAIVSHETRHLQPSRPPIGKGRPPIVSHETPHLQPSNGARRFRPPPKM
ncbi:hypothetical protein A2U01_0065110, partial [Trifolium medium]|nr:hypothetical protein [Trifolium medium]